MNISFVKKFDNILLITSPEKLQREVSKFLSEHTKFIKYYKLHIEGSQAFERYDFSKALNIYENLVNTLPESSIFQYMKGISFYYLKKFKEAKELFEKALQINPKNHFALFSLANMLYEKEPEKAYDYYIKTTKINKGLTTAYYSAAFLKFNSKDYREAEQLLLEVLKVDENYYEAIVLLADVYKFQQKFDEAEKYYLRSLNIRKEAIIYQQLQSIAFSQGKSQESIEYFEKAKELDPLLKESENAFKENFAKLSVEVLKAKDKDIFKKIGQTVGEVFIAKLKVNKIKHLETFEIELSADRKKHLFITGKNGSGKTSLLNALANRLQHLLDTPADTFFENSISQKDIASDSPINIYFNTIEQIAFRLKYESGNFIVKHYDVRRLLRAEGVEKVEKVEIPKQSRIQQDLADRMVAYLVDLDYTRLRAFREKDNETVEKLDKWFENFTKILQSVDSEIDKIVYTSDKNLHNFRIILKHLPNEFVDFSMLPDGFQAAFKIVFELILQMQPKITSSYDVEGVVLIDEPELYLHIEMQRKIMPILIQLFPKVQFIIATHSPYILNSASDVIIFDLFSHKRLTEVSNISANGLVKHHFEVPSEHSKIMDNKIKRLEELTKQLINAELNTKEQDEFAELETELKKDSPLFSDEMYERFQTIRKQLYNE